MHTLLPSIYLVCGQFYFRLIFHKSRKLWVLIDQSDFIWRFLVFSRYLDSIEELQNIMEEAGSELDDEARDQISEMLNDIIKDLPDENEDLEDMIKAAKEDLESEIGKAIFWFTIPSLDGAHLEKYIDVSLPMYRR